MRKISIFISSMALLINPFKAVKAMEAKSDGLFSCIEEGHLNIRDVLENFPLDEFAYLSRDERRNLIHELLKEKGCFEFDIDSYFLSEEYLDEKSTFSFKV
ncbi:hypothetical protein ACJVC5_07620 [Peredibacter sp. HCB2-198]|uniref:hypothetical protein n=1 Tax=Peredibacter sp. HCB2-198 TaxID=3383025 RepID=UPI0038B45E2F